MLGLETKEIESQSGWDDFIQNFILTYMYQGYLGWQL